MEEALQARVVQLQTELDSLHKAISVLNQLAAELDIHTAMQNVRQVALELLDCERVTLFLIFERRRELRAMIEQSEILRIQFGEGIAGLVAQTGGSMNLPDVYEHPMFNKEVDRITGFRTRSMLCMAVSDMTGKNVAVLQALNKKLGQPFTPADERNLKLFGTHLGNTLVKAKLHETAKREKERLQAIYNCFKSLSTAEEVGQMVVCATAALERHIIHADRVFFFLVDQPRGELWLHTHQAEPLRLRVGQPGGVVGLCAESKKPRSWAEYEDPSQDPALRRLAPQLAPARIKSVLVQPIHGTNNDRVLAVVLAINKREAEGTSDIFFEPFFTDADCDAMALFAYEVGDLLSERSLELSLLSALSVVGQDGAHPNSSHRSGAEGAGADGSCGAGTGSPHAGGPASGDEDLIRSQLIQMYLPEYKKEGPSSHGVFNRNSFSAANATANQVRASLDRKRAALLFESQQGHHQGGHHHSAKRGSGRGAAMLLGLGGGGAGAGGAARSGASFMAGRGSAWVSGRGQAVRSLGGVEEALTPAPTLNGYLAGTASAVNSEPPGSPTPCSDTSGDLQLLPELGALRCASSSQAEHPSLAIRMAAGGGAASFGGVSGGGGLGPLTCGSARSTGGGGAAAAAAAAAVRALNGAPVVGTAPAAGVAHIHAAMLGRSAGSASGGGGGRPPRVRPVSGPCAAVVSAPAAVPLSASAVHQTAHNYLNGSPAAAGAPAGAGGVCSGPGGAGGGGRLGPGFGRLMAPWRRPLLRFRSGRSPPGGPGDQDSDESDGGAGPGEGICSAGGEVVEGGVLRRNGEEVEPVDETEGVSDGEMEAVDVELDEGEPAAAGAAAGGRASRVSSSTHGQSRGPIHTQQQQQQQHAASAPQSQSQAHRPPPLEVHECPAPFSHPLALESLDDEAKAEPGVAAAWGVADPQALRSHLSCANFAQAGSPRSPCFYPQEQLRSWDWDFTEFSVDELIRLAYDIFIMSGAMEEFALKPKVLRNFLTAVASHYHAIPYHNFNHVCHVLHATFLISCTTRAANVLLPVERLALLLAALCHDLDHDGHSNSFHVNSGSELARIYNDQSVMENHHCAMTFAILSRTDCNVLAPLAPEEQRAARKAIISAILCTDMANHFAVTQEFQKHSVTYEPDNESDRLLLLKVVLHAADIGNAVRPFHVNHAMSRRVHCEFESQAGEEMRLGLPVTFNVDTSDHVMCARVELNFLDYVVTTLWERLVDVLPELAPQMAQLRVNRARYRRIADTGKTADQVLAEEAAQQPQQPSDAATQPQPTPAPEPAGPAASVAAHSAPDAGAPAADPAAASAQATESAGVPAGEAGAGRGSGSGAVGGGPGSPEDMAVSPTGSLPQLPDGTLDGPMDMRDSVMSDAQPDSSQQRERDHGSAP